MASMYVVNHLETPADGVYTDYGNYTDIQNLTDSQEPTVKGDEISFTRSKSEKGLYYQGTPGSAARFPSLTSSNTRWTAKPWTRRN